MVHPRAEIQISRGGGGGGWGGSVTVVSGMAEEWLCGCGAVPAGLAGNLPVGWQEKLFVERNHTAGTLCATTEGLWGKLLPHKEQ